MKDQLLKATEEKIARLEEKIKISKPEETEKLNIELQEVKTFLNQIKEIGENTNGTIGE